MLLNAGLDGLGVCADDLTNLLAVLEEDKGGHGADAEFLGDVGDLVNIELVEARLGVLLGEPEGLSDVLVEQDQGGNYLTMVGAIILQGPHHVAKQSRTMKVSLASRAFL